MSFFQKVLIYTILLFIGIAGCIFLTDTVGLNIGNSWHISDLFSPSGIATIVFLAVLFSGMTR